MKLFHCALIMTMGGRLMVAILYFFQTIVSIVSGTVRLFSKYQPIIVIVTSNSDLLYIGVNFDRKQLFFYLGVFGSELVNIVFTNRIDVLQYKMAFSIVFANKSGVQN